MPSTQGLFHRAIVQSGAHPRGVPAKLATKLASHLFEHLGMRVRGWRRDEVDEATVVERARKVIREIFPKAVAYIEKNHPNEYLGVFCKNAIKCKALADGLNAPSPLQTPPVADGEFGSDLFDRLRNG